MAIRTVVTRGYGNGTFNGTITDVVLRGYSIGAPPASGDDVYCVLKTLLSVRADALNTAIVATPIAMATTIIDNLTLVSYISTRADALTTTIDDTPVAIDTKIEGC